MSFCRSALVLFTLSPLLLAEPAIEKEEPVLPDLDATGAALVPRVVTEASPHDTDDPAIWVNRQSPAESLLLGTDKDTDGALLVYGLDGKIDWRRSVRGLLRPNNVDVAYGVSLGASRADIAVVTERYAHRLRAFRLPDLAAVDGGGLPVFAGAKANEPMGVALYTRPSDGALFAFVSRAPKHASLVGYVAQYQLVADEHGTLTSKWVRQLGEWSGTKEIEALAVDAELGYVYLADERHGIRKYHADPTAPDADRELAVFGTEGFSLDREGISILPTGPGKGYLIVSNQGSDTFRVFPREGTAAMPHQHPLLASIRVSTRESDGSDVTAEPFPDFPRGLFVAMSTDRTFHLYDAGELADRIRAAITANKP
jgi:3-phytase